AGAAEQRGAADASGTVDDARGYLWPAAGGRRVIVAHGSLGLLNYFWLSTLNYVRSSRAGGANEPRAILRRMNRADAAQRVAELREAIRHHDYAYYVEARPQIADSEDDALRRELGDLETAISELVTHDSPTQRVSGQPVEAFRPVEHRVAMLSLDNATAPEDLREFEGRLGRALPGARFSYVCEPKIDGLG